MFTLCISEGRLHALDHRNVLTSQVKHDPSSTEKVEYRSSLFLHGNKHFGPNLPSLPQFHIKASGSTSCVSHASLMESLEKSEKPQRRDKKAIIQHPMSGGVAAGFFKNN